MIRTPDPLHLVTELLDAAGADAQARVAQATTLEQQETFLSHQQAIEDAANYLLGADPTPNWQPFVESVVAMHTPGRGWHVHTTPGTYGYLTTMTPERDGGAIADGLLYRLTLDQRDLAHRLLHPEEVAARFDIPIERIGHLVTRGALPHCTIEGITWIVETSDLNIALQAPSSGHDR
jgi:hypothetical protein